MTQRRESSRSTLFRYTVHSSISWYAFPVVLTSSVLLTVGLRSRPWAGDWAFGLGWSSLAVLFTSIVLAAVAAYDTGSALTGDRAAAWNTQPRPGCDVLRLWWGSLLPFIVAQALTVATVIGVLAGTGGVSVGSWASPAQQGAVLGVSAALGCLCGALLGARTGSFTALVAASYLTYGLGYVGDRVVPPAHLDIASHHMLGLELNPVRVAAQCVVAGAWILALLSLAATTRASGNGARRVSRAPLAVATAAILLTYAVAPLVQGQPVETTAETRVRCVSAEGSDDRAVPICLMVGHDPALPQLARRVTTFAQAARAADIADVVPARLDEAPSGAVDRYGLLVLGPDDDARHISIPTLAQALMGGRDCPEVTDPSPDSTPTFERYLALGVQAEQTVSDMLDGRPPNQWAMSPRQFQVFVRGSVSCNLDLAVGAA
ncbi:hypothetical protein [Angustibacter luteus]|uniref:ABC transporter permease n=1 Tax=Angustibacter luteus TaxID=658456 RepID=A0ABW1J9T4_9ACTN